MYLQHIDLTLNWCSQDALPAALVEMYYTKPPQHCAYGTCPGKCCRHLLSRSYLASMWQALWSLPCLCKCDFYGAWNTAWSSAMYRQPAAEDTVASSLKKREVTDLSVTLHMVGPLVPGCTTPFTSSALRSHPFPSRHARGATASTQPHVYIYHVLFIPDFQGTTTALAA